MTKYLLLILTLSLAIGCKEITAQTPAEVKVKYVKCCGGGCLRMNYEVYPAGKKLYYFFDRDITKDTTAHRKELDDHLNYLKFYTKDKCIVIELIDERDSRILQGYFSEYYCTDNFKPTKP